MMEFVRRHTIVLLLVALIVVAVSASYYKYVVLADFTTIFYSECDPTSEICFISTYSCEEEQTPECLYHYKIYAVNQNKIDDICDIDDGSCLEEFCSTGECTTLYCGDPEAANYTLQDECSEIEI